MASFPDSIRALQRRHGGHDDMDMDMDDGRMGMGGGGTGSAPLETTGVNFSNLTQASEFLEELLNDDGLKVIGNTYAQYFWYGVATVIAIAALFNLVRFVTLRLRVRAAARNVDSPARPKRLLPRIIATLTAVARESTYLQFTSTAKYAWLQVPPLGTLVVILAHFAFVVGLEFTNNDVAGAQFWQARGVRAGWLAVAQTPLLILLVGKYNIIGMLTGVSYERINIFHRWTARIMLFMAVLHFGYQSYGWQKFGLMTLEWSTDECPPTGMAAFALLLWINLSTLAPFRRMSYEVFVIQHLLTFFGFIIALVYHLPSTAPISRIYVYIPIALWFVDRSVQWIFTTIRSLGTSATITALDGEATKVRLSSRGTKHWPPGSFVLLSIPRFGLVQSHPATIVSTPRSHGGDMVFILKCHGGFTKRLMTHANNSATSLLPHTRQESEEQQLAQVATHRAFINGPYGGSHSALEAYDSVLLMAGSTGVTFTLSVLQSLADKACLGEKLPVRRVCFVWCIKDSSWTRWCSDELAASFEQLQRAGIDVDINVYVTCADSFTEQGNEPKECGCACDKSLGPCCCVLVDDTEDEVNGDETPAKNGVIKTTSMSSVPGATRLQVLPCASFFSGRPDVPALLTDLLDGAEGESAVAVCGPIAMSSSVRNTVVRLSDERAIHKGTGAQGCYLHVEAFSLG